ncbi:radical SAM protein [Bradyrhizobium sp. I1.14.4]|uniref:radical SAM protein n=1 Tax=unclassified Bradyrhizobium TaxID=2631580 RepID=UPI003D1D78DE
MLEAKPTIISYTPSHRCNIRCTHCYQEETRDAEIKRADAADEIERLAPYLVRLIAGGGEPFLLPIWRRFLANFDTRKNPYLDFGTSTNATIVTEPVLAGLRRFKNMTINVSLDGTGETYERVRVGAKFDEVRANIRRLKEVVKAAPSPKANIGISMCVMKSNILDLPNLVRFARDEVLQFGMSPVITRPPDESLRCFNDPVKDMAGWADAIDAAKAELDSYFPSLAVVWRSQSVPDETQETWRNLFEVLRAQIPLDLADVPHKRVTLDIPDELMMRAAAAHGVAPLVAYIFPQRTTDGVSYWGPIKDGRCEVSLPDGAFSVGVSTKWAATGGNGGFFDVGDHQPDDAPIPVQAPTHRYSPRRVAAGVMRRARRMLDRVTEG